MDIEQKRTWVKLERYLDRNDFEKIKALEYLCISHDRIALKLELEYKLSDAMNTNESSEGLRTEVKIETNEFLYFHDSELIGYLGVCKFGGLKNPFELTGMVHPEYRRKGIFTQLLNLALAECRRRSDEDILALCDRNSYSGQKFMETVSAELSFSEYEMYLKQNLETKKIERKHNRLVLRKAINKDAPEVARQNRIYFDDSLEESDEMLQEEGIILPEEEEKRGMTIYIAEEEETIIGKVHLQRSDSLTGIYGLGVLPEFRGKGYGKEILLSVIDQLEKEEASQIMLQVAAENETALNLYHSSGFEKTSVMDYYLIKKQDSL